MTRADHFDVASYALGILDERDTARFEEHLADCWECAEELESLLPVVDLLADVDGDDLAVMERATANDAMLNRALVAVDADRRRARSRQMYALAAGVVLVALLSGVALVSGLRGGDSTGAPVAGPTVTAPTGTSPGAPAGETVTATDPGSGVRAELVLTSRPFGTQLGFALSNLTGPRTCRLVVVPRDGPPEVLASWTVPVKGYGTPEQPTPLTLQSATASTRADIERVQVQQIESDGTTKTLVSVPL